MDNANTKKAESIGFRPFTRGRGEAIEQRSKRESERKRGGEVTVDVDGSGRDILRGEKGWAHKNREPILLL